MRGGHGVDELAQAVPEGHQRRHPLLSLLPSPGAALRASTTTTDNMLPGLGAFGTSANHAVSTCANFANF